LSRSFALCVIYSLYVSYGRINPLYVQKSVSGYLGLVRGVYPNFRATVGYQDPLYQEREEVVNHIINNDQTYKKMSTLTNIPTKIVTYGEIDGVLNDLIEANAAYDTVVEKRLINQHTSDSKQEILTTIGAENFKMKYPHTLVLFDDAMSVFKNKQLPLVKKLFKSRQLRITYFLCLQDIIGLDASIKANIDTIQFFGGFNRQKFNLFYYQSSIPIDKDKVWEQYINLTKRQALIVLYSNDGTKIKILES
ncbi:MAG: hypothetical protein EZS28_042696, partial [Streblomastix strix]